MTHLYVQLGRIGDILSILPLAWLDAQKGEKPGLMVAKDFAGILDGVSYVEPVIWNGSMLQLDKAVEQADKLSKKVIVTQLVGPYEAIHKIVIKRNGLEYKTTRDSFQKDQWVLADRMADWKKQPPLVLDRRNLEREHGLVDRFVGKRKLILVAAKGISSPFAWKNLLLTLLKSKFGSKYDILDLEDVVAERFFDLLGLYEKAFCLVTIDTAHLHLAYACPSLPVVALCNDKPNLWNGSAWRPQHICYVRYSDFDSRAGDILGAISGIGWNGCWFSAARSMAQFHHVYSEYEGKWTGTLPKSNWVSTPIQVGMAGRDSRSALKDKRRFPFVKDVIRLGCMRAKDDDHILLTRCDTQIPSLPELNGTPAFAHRMHGGSWHPACDLFVFPKSWWVKHQSEYPDLVMGRDWTWHRVLKELILKTGGRELPLTVTRNAPVKKPEKQDDPPKYLKHNYELATDWLEENKIEFTYPPVGKQVTEMPLQIQAMRPFGYNPGIIRHDGRMLMAYRHHFNNSAATRLRIVELNDNWEVISDRPLDIPNSNVSVEDAKFFTNRGELWLSWIDSKWYGRSPVEDAKCVVKYARLMEKDEWTVEALTLPEYGTNNYKTMEKNWVFFGRNERVFCIYKSSPAQEILEFDAGHARPCHVHESPTLNWAYGPIKGGTNPVPFEGKLLRFFHSTLDNEPPPWYRRYYIGAMLMEPEPPFRQIALSSKPIIRGSEYCALSDIAKSQCFHFKGNVVFPGGCVVDGDGWLVSVGVNDYRCSVVKLTREDLHL